VLPVVPALAAATGFALFQLVNRRALTGVDVYRGTAALLAVGSVLLLVISGLTGGLGGLADASVATLLYAAGAAFLHFFVGWTLLAWSQVRLGVARTGILIGTVPLFGALVAAAALDEPLTSFGVVGLLLVVAGVGVVSARGGHTVSRPADVRAGVLAGLATALCWSVSPVLIRQALAGLPSPLAGAGIGMLACAVVYAAMVLLLGTARSERPPIERRTVRLLVLGGILVSLAIWMQSTAYDLLPVATVLALLQLTPVTVVLLAVRLGGDVLSPMAARRLWIGTVLTVVGSLILVLLGR
jgi:drug/metabolite transporter (DMT)-like permease